MATIAVDMMIINTADLIGLRTRIQIAIPTSPERSSLG